MRGHFRTEMKNAILTKIIKSHLTQLSNDVPVLYNNYILPAQHYFINLNIWKKIFLIYEKYFIFMQLVSLVPNFSAD